MKKLIIGAADTRPAATAAAAAAATVTTTTTTTSMLSSVSSSSSFVGFRLPRDLKHTVMSFLNLSDYVDAWKVNRAYRKTVARYLATGTEFRQSETTPLRLLFHAHEVLRLASLARNMRVFSVATVSTWTAAEIKDDIAAVLRANAHTLKELGHIHHSFLPLLSTCSNLCHLDVDLTGGTRSAWNSFLIPHLLSPIITPGSSSALAVVSSDSTNLEVKHSSASVSASMISMYDSSPVSRLRTLRIRAFEIEETTFLLDYVIRSLPIKLHGLKSLTLPRIRQMSDSTISTLATLTNLTHLEVCANYGPYSPPIVGGDRQRAKLALPLLKRVIWDVTKNSFVKLQCPKLEEARLSLSLNHVTTLGDFVSLVIAGCPRLHKLDVHFESDIHAPSTWTTRCRASGEKEAIISEQCAQQLTSFTGTGSVPARLFRSFLPMALNLAHLSLAHTAISAQGMSRILNSLPKLASLSVWSIIADDGGGDGDVYADVAAVSAVDALNAIDAVDAVVSGNNQSVQHLRPPFRARANALTSLSVAHLCIEAHLFFLGLEAPRLDRLEIMNDLPTTVHVSWISKFPALTSLCIAPTGWRLDSPPLGHLTRFDMALHCLGPHSQNAPLPIIMPHVATLVLRKLCKDEQDEKEQVATNALFLGMTVTPSMLAHIKTLLAGWPSVRVLDVMHLGVGAAGSYEQIEVFCRQTGRKLQRPFVFGESVEEHLD